MDSRSSERAEATRYTSSGSASRSGSPADSGSSMASFIGVVVIQSSESRLSLSQKRSVTSNWLNNSAFGSIISILRSRSVTLPDLTNSAFDCGSACITDQSVSPRCRVVSIANDSGSLSGGIFEEANTAPEVSSMRVTFIFRLNHAIAEFSWVRQMVGWQQTACGLPQLMSRSARALLGRQRHTFSPGLPILFLVFPFWAPGVRFDSRKGGERGMRQEGVKSLAVEVVRATGRSEWSDLA